MIASSGDDGSSSLRSQLRTWPWSMTRHGARSAPTRNATMVSMGLVVADTPTRVGGRSQSAASRSRETAKCAPRLLPARAWISSTITVSTVPSIRRPDSEVSRMYSDSGVVTRMWGASRRIFARSLWVVSPVRTRARMHTSGNPDSSNSSRMPASGACRFLLMSLDSAFSGDTYRMRVSSASPPSSPRLTSASMTARKAARVLPDPVGALIRVWEPAPIACHARSCTAVAAGNWPANQLATAG